MRRSEAPVPVAHRGLVEPAGCGKRKCALLAAEGYDLFVRPARLAHRSKNT